MPFFCPDLELQLNGVFLKKKPDMEGIAGLRMVRIEQRESGPRRLQWRCNTLVPAPVPVLTRLAGAAALVVSPGTPGNGGEPEKNLCLEV